MAYKLVTALITSSDYVVEKVKEIVQAWAPDIEISYDENMSDQDEVFHLKWDDWFLRFFFEEDNNVIKNAKKVGRLNENKTVEKAKKSLRIFCWGKEPDHLEGYISLLEYLRKTPSFYLYDMETYDLIESKPTPEILLTKENYIQTMDHVEAEFVGRFVSKVNENETDFLKIYKGFKHTCIEMNISERDDLEYSSIMLERDGGEYDFAFYYNVIKLTDGEEADDNLRLNISVYPDCEEIPKEFDEYLVKEWDYSILGAFPELESMPDYEFLKTHKARFKICTRNVPRGLKGIKLKNA